MPTFNGEILICTLDSGVTEVVWQDVYSAWKDWLLGTNWQNRKYPKMFAPDGGAELTSIIDQGRYYFLQNQFGWRIKPPEENITVYAVGNLAVNDTTLPAFIPTTGTFTAAILGLQPITQGVTPAMGDQLAFATFQGAVCIDPLNGHEGTGSIGSDEIGTRKAPAKKPSDALIIAQREGLTVFNLVNDLTLTTALDFSAGYSWHGDRPQIQLNILSPPIVLNCAVGNLTLIGELDGVNTIRESSIGAVTNVSGFIEKCSFFGDVTLSGALNVYESYSQKAGAGYVTFDIGSYEFQISDWHRSIGITNMTGGIHTIEMYGGQLHLDNLCVGGTIYLRGNYSLPPDDQSNGTILIDQTENKNIDEIHGQIRRGVFIDTEQIVNGNGFQQSPYNNWTDGVDYAESNGLKTLYPVSDANVDRQLKNFTIEGVGLPKIDISGHIMDKSIFKLCALTGSYSGDINAIECALINLSGLNGVFYTVNAAGTLTVGPSGSATLWNVAPAIAGQAWVLSMNGGVASTCAIHKCSGEFSVINMDHVNDILHIHSDNGRVTISASCLEGAIEVSGDIKIIDNSGPNCIVTITDTNTEILLDAIA